MKILEQALGGLLLIEPKIFNDNRGLFFESFNQQVFQDLVGAKIEFIQDNHSISVKNVVRGLHLQVPPFEQGKLVRVVHGKVYDVAVDVRKNSPTYGNYYGAELSAENKRMLWIPPGFAHGFSVLEENTVFLYKCTNVYHKASERTIAYNDGQLGINWQVENPIVSEKDLEGVAFKEFNTAFEYA